MTGRFIRGKPSASLWDGYQVARRMREKTPVSSLTIIALSGFGETEDFPPVQASGM